MHTHAHARTQACMHVLSLTHTHTHTNTHTHQREEQQQPLQQFKVSDKLTGTEAGNPAHAVTVSLYVRLPDKENSAIFIDPDAKAGSWCES